MLNIGVYDTQCGAKFFHTDVLEDLFIEKFKTKWLFDIEIFFRYKKLHENKDIGFVSQEVPLKNWEDVGGQN